MLSVLNGAILMSTHNIQFHDKVRKCPLVFVFLNYRKNFVGTQKRVRINHGFRALEVRLYIYINFFSEFVQPNELKMKS